jgi:Phage endonuclease I
LKPALKAAIENAEIENDYRSGLEQKVAEQLKAAGIEAEYETYTIPYSVPAREAKYKPDFTANGIILEAKGHFGGKGFRGRNFNMTANSAKERQKFALLKEQHPELDIRFVFERASAPIYKGSPTTHGKWATDHGFPWSDKGRVPPEWIEEMKSKGNKRKKK